MFLPLDKTVLQKVMESTLNTFTTSAADTIETSNSTIDDGNIVYKVPLHKEPVAALMTSPIATCLTKKSHNKSGNTLLRAVTEKFINIKANATFTECLNTIYNYQSQAGKHFYGALLRDVDNPDVILNPYHILTALAVLDNEEYLSKRYNILLFFYTNRSMSDAHFSTKKASSDLIDQNINAIMRSYVLRQPTIINVTDSAPQPNGDIKVTYREAIGPGEDKNKIAHLVAHQLLTDGIIAPYYGTGLVLWGRDKSWCGGVHVSPFRSCNINGHSEVFGTSYDIDHHSVCTGSSYENTTLAGLRTLTHAYLGSPHNSSCVVVGALAYADAMIAKATDLYIRAGILVPPPKPDEFTEEELSCSTFAEFAALRNKGKKSIANLRTLQTYWKKLKAEQFINAGVTILNSTVHVGDSIAISFRKAGTEHWTPANTGVVKTFTTSDITILNTLGKNKRLNISSIKQIKKDSTCQKKHLQRTPKFKL